MQEPVPPPPSHIYDSNTAYAHEKAIKAEPKQQGYWAHNNDRLSHPQESSQYSNGLYMNSSTDPYGRSQEHHGSYSIDPERP